jgi:phosphomannomutase
MTILFDMDGTLTPARKPMTHKMAIKLGELSRKFNIGIVTGSGLNYVLEQCSILKEVFNIDWSKIYLLPCNGTQVYRMEKGIPKQVFSVDMKNFVGGEKYRLLVSKLCYEQSIFVATHTELDTFGTFVQYRGSLLNWCPIGRDSDHNAEAREKFVEFDKRTGFRERTLVELTGYLDKNGDNPVTIALGGDTSFDIYPTGWDKTYALNHFDVTKTGKIVFVGDRCKGHGNDRTIYEACLPDAYETTGPENTFELIQGFLNES